MARKTLTPIVGTAPLGINGTAARAAGAVLTADGAVYDNVNQTGWIVVENTTAGAIVLTISTDRTYSPQAAGSLSKSYTIPANANDFYIPPINNNFWSQAGTDNVYLDTDADGLNIMIVEPG